MSGNNVYREIKELTLLFEISTKLSETLDLKTVKQPILKMTTEYMGILWSTPGLGDDRANNCFERRSYF